MTRERVAKRREVQQLEAHSEKRARTQEKSTMGKKRPRTRTQAVAIQQELQQKEAAPLEGRRQGHGDNRHQELEPSGSGAGGQGELVGFNSWQRQLGPSDKPF